MLKNRKLWFLIALFTILFSFNCFAADDDAEPDWDAVSLSEGSTVLNKARQVAARRSSNMSIMSADSDDTTNPLSTSGVGSRIVQKTGDAGKNKVNIQGAYLFADECIYPFSTFNHPKMGSNWKNQLFVWVGMQNDVVHADWKCIEKKTISYDTDCNNDSEGHTCPPDKPDEVSESTTSNKCNAAPWNPIITTSFGRSYKSNFIHCLAYSVNSCDAVDQMGWIIDAGSLLAYGVYWTPKNVADPQSDPANMNPIGDYHLATEDLIRHRIIINEKLLTEEKQFGTGSSGG